MSENEITPEISHSGALDELSKFMETGDDIFISSIMQPEILVAGNHFAFHQDDARFDNLQAASLQAENTVVFQVLGDSNGPRLFQNGIEDIETLDMNQIAHKLRLSTRGKSNLMVFIDKAELLDLTAQKRLRHTLGAIQATIPTVNPNKTDVHKAQHFKALLRAASSFYQPHPDLVESPLFNMFKAYDDGATSFSLEKTQRLIDEFRNAVRRLREANYHNITLPARIGKSTFSRLLAKQCPQAVRYIDLQDEDLYPRSEQNNVITFDLSALGHQCDRVAIVDEAQLLDAHDRGLISDIFPKSIFLSVEDYVTENSTKP